MTDIAPCINVIFKESPSKDTVSAIHVSLRLCKENCGLFNLSLDFNWDEIIKSMKELENLIVLIKRIHELANPYYIYLDYEMVSFIENKIDFSNKKVLGFNQICLFSKSLLDDFEKFDFPLDSYTIEHLDDGAVFMVKNDLIKGVKRWEDYNNLAESRFSK